MNVILVPLLPPKPGYVEVINELGIHVYKPTNETIEKTIAKEESESAYQMLNAFFGVSSDGLEINSALEFNKAVQLFAVSLEDEETMMSIPSVYPEYKVGVAYKTKDKFRYGTNSVGDPQLYQVLQDHTSAAEWTPDSATSLYKKIGVSDDGTPLWVQPLGATDAYNIGDQVMYNGKKYESLINANVWAPDVYPAGWKLVEDEATEPVDPGTDPVEPDEPATTVPDFVQPSGAHDAYSTGDRVNYNGHIYESLIDNNVWSPDAYPAGWQLIE